MPATRKAASPETPASPPDRLRPATADRAAETLRAWLADRRLDTIAHAVALRPGVTIQPSMVAGHARTLLTAWDAGPHGVALAAEIADFVAATRRTLKEARP